ncbi:MAG: hypothetical protein IVW57_19540 [Ktedonobacterales bacterium]|nr:hypothetical protein [Ktedonobacterales bacterium]
MLDVRRIFARQPQVALAEGDAAATLPRAVIAAIDAPPTLATSGDVMEAWQVNAGPFFTADGQSAVAFAALLQTAEFQLQ